MQTELFSLEEKRIVAPERPLAGFSAFVVEHLPVLLSEYEDGSVDAHKFVSLATQQTDSIDLGTIEKYLSEAKHVRNGFGIYPFHQRLDLASLDLKMLETALVQLELPSPRKLVALIDQTSKATKQLPTLTYEDLIYINPPRDMRTFTTGRVGAAESDFYHGHLLIEKSLERSINFVRDSIFSLTHLNHDKADQQLAEAISIFKGTFQFMTDIGLKMDKADFAAFRKYLTTHPIRNLKGPSGAFTPSIPIMDMLVGGENIDERYYEYLKDNFSYYPRMGQRGIAEAYDHVTSGKTLNSLTNQNGLLNVTAKVQELSDLIRQFRGLHYKGVKHQIPQAVSGQIKGTAGEDDPGKFLRDRMRMRHTGK